MSDVNQGRSSRGKRGKVEIERPLGEVLKVRSPLDMYVSATVRAEQRRARVAEKESALPACGWCGRPVLARVRPEEHDVCRAMLALAARPAS